MVSAGTSTSKHQHFAEVLQVNELPQRGHFFCSNGRSLLFIDWRLNYLGEKRGENEKVRI
jgi:hypothetical protein